MTQDIHTSVLLNEVVEGLQVKPKGRYIDATLGFGGHTRALLDAAAGTSVLGIERDPEVAQYTKDALKSYGDRIEVVNKSYEHLSDIVNSEKTYDGIVFDLGYSSWHVDDSGKGFSFSGDEPLDMRYNPQGSSESAADIVNNWKPRQLIQIFEEFGEEPKSRLIANAIVKHRAEHQIRTTKELVEVVQTVKKPGKGMHPATQVFQALRIAVNDELGALQRALPQVLDVITPGGRIVIISFHSLEDRIVKRFFKHFDTEAVWVVTKKPITPTEEEIEANPRARSAKLRVAQRT